ncbi:ankyrin repeat domain-containing protein SOWAHC [Tiliqua scincoides]|uniref:ankyrin repeat domain-containing protein SOWAHC n=1 Tax=Tiliqua scincoides TaxID=71010 RepID=UPI003462868D
MAASAELTQDAVLRFLAERGGRARNADLLEHFRGFLNSPEPQRRARARERFKELVNAVATVRQDPGSGAKYVQLRRKYQSAAGSSPRGDASAAGTAGQPVPETPRLPPEPPGGGGRDGDAAAEAEDSGVATTSVPSGDSFPAGGSEEASRPPPPEAPPPLLGAEVPQSGLEPPEGGAGQKKSDSSCSSDKVGREEDEGAQAEEPYGGSGEARPEDVSPCSSPPPASPAALGEPPAAAAPTTPRSGRKNIRERVLGSSPQLKRGGLLPRGGGSRGGGDSDSASLASSSAEDESGSGGGSVALDPLEHAWMLCASDGRWEILEGLLSCEPALLAKRDFITGFTCLHWAAKHGRHELLAMLVNFGHRHRLPVNINARTSGGYTALHLAAMHGHLEVVKLLVGAYDADVDIRDYSGRKASHYLSRGTAEGVRHLVGALQDEANGGAPNGSGRWRLSKVLPANLIAYKLSHLHHGDEGESGEGAAALGKGKELSRKTSGSGRIKPRLNKIRFRTQIIHTNPSFRGDAEEEGQEEKSLKASFKLRPKSNVFG